MSKPSIRCAIYTRKSSDEGLEQEFNSLDAQYEACANYIASQRHEGWKLSKERYDDGGISGGTIDRPGLQQLLADIDAGRIQMIVVYKIDRLTRSLADFAKLVDRLEAANCSFVSVTQSFNTSTSMGRLTLNVLLSFAQFEREVTAERIRDKIAASKKKGLWMGGVCPLGYDKDPKPQARTLVVNPKEADVVKTLFDLYREHGCLRTVEQKAHAQSLVSKRHVFKTGRVTGGHSFSRGQIYHILRNPIYLGMIRHKEKVWPGLHPAIIEQGVWDQVQDLLTQASQRKRGGGLIDNTSKRVAGGSILIGKIFDEKGDRLTPTHTVKNKRKIRYYVSNRLISGGVDPSGWRLPAQDLEQKILNIIADHIESCVRNYTLTINPQLHAAEHVQDQAKLWLKSLRSDGAEVCRDFIESIHIKPGELQVKLSSEVLATGIGVEANLVSEGLKDFSVPWSMRRRGVESKIIIGLPKAEPDQNLIRALARSHLWVQEMKEGIAPGEIARKQGVTTSYIRAVSKLAFLSPRVQKAILSGNLTPEFTTNKMTHMKIPLDWQRQDSLFCI